MQASGVVEHIQFSSQSQKLRCSQLISDWNSKTNLLVLPADPYARTLLQKIEFVGHFRKKSFQEFSIYK